MGKWIFDRVLALLLVLPLTLIILPFLVLIRLESPGSPIFFQTRVGKNQRRFKLLKLRTMRAGIGDRASHEICPSTITKTGQFLRRTKLDEYPQVWNILIGDMSFVGPRPCLPNQEQLIQKRAELGVFSVLPGVTGLAQLSGVDMSTPEKLAKIDADYIARRSLKGDLRLIVMTARGRGAGDACAL